MKLKRRIFFIGITLLILVLGFALPSISAVVQDRLDGNQALSRGIKSVNLATSSAGQGVAELLEFAGSMDMRYSSVQLGLEEDEADKNAAYQAALEFLSLYEEKGAQWLGIEKYPEHFERSFWAAKDEAELKKMWLCTLVYRTGDLVTSDTVIRDAVVNVIIDDASKKMVSFNMLGMSFDEAELQLLGGALSDYYGFAGSSLTQNDEIQFTDSSEKALGLRFTQFDDYIYFNSSENVRGDPSISDGWYSKRSTDVGG